MTTTAHPDLKVNRRRFITICAAACAGMALAPGQAGAGAMPDPMLHRWRGIALGARAEINLLHENEAGAGKLFRLVEAEVRRLEAIFSLYLEDSELARLNRDGRLEAPSLDMVNLLGLAHRVHAATEGAFDPTIQPLWAYYADRAARKIAVDSGPGINADVERILERTGFREVAFEPGLVEFRRKGMALTLNGIAQGYITDRVTGLLGARGCKDVVVDMGEISATGRAPQADGPGRRGWSVTLRPDPLRPEAQTRVDIVDAAAASSARSGTTFDPAGRLSHILDPRTGHPVQADLVAASVVAGTAACADGLSTAALVCGERGLSAALAHFPEARAFVVRESSSCYWLA